MLPKVIDLNAVVDDLHAMLKKLIRENIKIVLELTSTPNVVKADKSQIEQVILNLAINARDSMPSGGTLTIKVTAIEIAETKSNSNNGIGSGSYVVMKVSDSGKGMNEQTQSQIFEPFFTTKALGKGTGLGLSTVYGIVKQSGGHISVSSQPDKGATFTIHLPQVKEPITRSLVEETVKSLNGSETILFVEDEEQVRKLAKRLLENNGYTVILAQDAQDAQKVMAEYKRPVHLLITDLMLPDITGSQLAKKLTETHKELKVLYISGYSYDLLHEERDGIENAFIQKPFTEERLTRGVRTLLDRPAA